MESGWERWRRAMAVTLGSGVVALGCSSSQPPGGPASGPSTSGRSGSSESPADGGSGGLDGPTPSGSSGSSGGFSASGSASSSGSEAMPPQDDGGLPFGVDASSGRTGDASETGDAMADSGAREGFTAVGGSG